MVGKTINEIKVGDKSQFAKTITETDVILFAGITGDMNPAHTNKVEAEKGIFKGRVVHGMFTASMISTILGMYLPGPGTIFLGQETKFLKPVRINDTITAEIEAIEVNVEKNMVVFSSVAHNQDGEKVLVGQATVMPPKK